MTNRSKNVIILSESLSLLLGIRLIIMEKFTPEKIRNKLLSMQDTAYRDFHSRLMPTVDKAVIIGVRTPHVRRLANEIHKSGGCDEFMTSLPHRYYEENNVHAVLIEKIKDPQVCITALEHFLPYVDNWATCDLLNPKRLSKDPQKLKSLIDRLLLSEHTYTVRFAIKMMMTYFLEENFSPEFPKKAAAVKSEEYYVRMMVAWYFATALAKQYDRILPYIKEKKLDKWTHNKTIQKAKESYRLTEEQKKHLSKFKL